MLIPLYIQRFGFYLLQHKAALRELCLFKNECLRCVLPQINNLTRFDVLCFCCPPWLLIYVFCSLISIFKIQTPTLVKPEAINK